MTSNMPAPIVVGVDGSPAANAALDWAVAEAGRRRLTLRLVHVVEWDPYGPLPAGEPAQVIAAALAQVQDSAPDLGVTAGRIEGSTPAAGLVEQSEWASLLVVGNRGRGGFTNLLAGSVSVQTAAHAHCPVVVVRR